MYRGTLVFIKTEITVKCMSSKSIEGEKHLEVRYEACGA